MVFNATDENFTVAFSEAIYADSSGTAFTNTTIGNIVTLKNNGPSGTDIAAAVTISGNTITINPTDDISPGSTYVYIGISDGWYFGSGGTKTQGTAEHIYTGNISFNTYGSSLMTSDGGGVLSGSTLTATRPILHIATDGTYWGYYQTGPQSYSAACTGAAHTNSTIGSVISFRQGSAGGPAIPFTVFLTNTPDGGPAPDYVTIVPSADLPAGTYHLSFSPQFVGRSLVCSTGQPASALFTIESATSLTVSTVATDDYINDTEDESSLTISGTSNGLTDGTSVTVTVDGSGTDVTKTVSISSNAWTTSLTSAQVKALDASTPAAGGETITITAAATGATSGTRTVTYDPTAPTVTAGSTGYYSESALTNALSGSVGTGTDIYTKVTFAEVVGKTVSDTSTARPVISYSLAGTDTQYDIIASGTPATGDCVESGSGASDGKQYTCRYTVASGNSGSFGVKVGTSTADPAGNTLASTYTHGTTLTADTTLPTITAAIYNGSTITLTMSEQVAVSGTKTGGDFTITGGGAPTVSSYAISGSTVTLTLSAAITGGGSVTLAYAKNATAANRITDTAGNELGAVSSQSVTSKSISVSIVSTDDYINATEDNSAVLIAGTSSGLANNTTITITLDDADADTNADHTFTATTNSTGAWTTAATDLTAARVQALDEGEMTITASADGAGSGTRTVIYDATAPTATAQSVSGGYVDAAEDDSNVSVYTTGNEMLSAVTYSITDGTDTKTPTAKRSGIYSEKLDNAMSAITLANSDLFGSRVARDGVWLAVSAYQDDTGGTNYGTVYLIKDGDNDGDWKDATSNDVVEINNSTAGITLGSGDFFGFGLDLDNGTVAIGVTGDDTGGTNYGAVYLVSDGGDDWASIEATDVVTINNDTAGITLAANDYFGTAVALDGDLLAVGASYADADGTNKGEVYLIKDGGDNWDSIAATDITKVTHSSTLGITLANNDHFGYGVALDNGILAVGADGDTSNAGAVYILNDKNNDGDWADTGENIKLSNSTPGITLTAGDKFGTAVALDSDLLAVGAIGTSSGKGAVYLVDAGGDNWGSIAAGDSILLDDSKDGITLTANDHFGIGVTLDAGALAVGAYKDDTGGTDRGAVYVFDAAFEGILATGDFEKGTPAANKLAEGTITVSATPTDLAGNTGTAATSTFTYDQTVPTISPRRLTAAAPSPWICQSKSRSPARKQAATSPSPAAAHRPFLPILSAAAPSRSPSAQQLPAADR